MKKLVLSLAAVAAFGFTANAQETEKPTFGFQESNVFVEGMFQISNSTSKLEGASSKDKKTNFTFNPKVGYMLSDKLAVGVSAAFGKNSDSETSFGGAFDKVGSVKGYMKETYVGAFARYYFLELGQRFKTYAEVGVGYHQGVKEQALGKDLKATGVKAGLNVGMNYFVTSNMAISFNLGDVFTYGNYNTKMDGTKVSTDSKTEANVNIFNNFFDNATFGLTYKF
ncbi:porin family protein [Myroides sp. M-43]|uniref:porin family protein n=1 Tax=Myroides oncorhynchi TaxID=2893756 RepID=UPI001E30D4F4|nr:porin family protein [Myroides oncorhynchi]MCC9042972.1 porin family protein [Myroides oncorhynchi]